MNGDRNSFVYTMYYFRDSLNQSLKNKPKFWNKRDAFLFVNAVNYKNICFIQKNLKIGTG